MSHSTNERRRRTHPCEKREGATKKNWAANDTVHKSGKKERKEKKLVLSPFFCSFAVRSLSLLGTILGPFYLQSPFCGNSGAALCVSGWVISVPFPPGEFAPRDGRRRAEYGICTRTLVTEIKKNIRRGKSRRFPTHTYGKKENAAHSPVLLHTSYLLWSIRSTRRLERTRTDSVRTPAARKWIQREKIFFKKMKNRTERCQKREKMLGGSCQILIWRSFWRSKSPKT